MVNAGYANIANIGCRSSYQDCMGASNYNTQFTYTCPVSPVVAPVLWSISSVIGLIVGGIVYMVTLNSDMRRLVQASYGLFALSFLFFPAALFSFMLSVRVSNKVSRKCCNCQCFWLWHFGLLEVMTVIAGILTGAVMDATISPVYNTSFFPGFFSVVVGIPTVYGGLLVFGIPRVLIMSCLGRQKAKTDDEFSRDDSINGPRRDMHEHRESAPLLSPADAPRRAPAAAAVPPSYFPAPHTGPAPSYQVTGPYVANDGGQFNK